MLETTAEHPFYVVERGWVPTSDLQPGDLLLGRDEQTACVQSVTATTRTATVYNLRVAADHTFFVGSHAWGFSLWVHNTYKIQPSKIDGKWDVVDPFGNPVLKNLDEAQADEIAKGLNDWKAGKGGADEIGSSKPVDPSPGAPNRITGDALAKMRKEFNAVKPQAWMDEAAKNAHKYTPDQLKRMRAGHAPIGADGFPMEIHHRTPLAEGGGNVFDNFDFLTRTDHRLGPNYKRNHPNLP